MEQTRNLGKDASRKLSAATCRLGFRVPLLVAGGLIFLSVLMLAGCATMEEAPLEATLEEPGVAGTNGLESVGAPKKVGLLPRSDVAPFAVPEWVTAVEQARPRPVLPNIETEISSIATPRAASKATTPKSEKGTAEVTDGTPLVPPDHEYCQLGAIRGQSWPLVFNQGQAEEYPNEEGVCSYYWGKQKVACGDWYKADALTAAHRTLPFGTIVRVTIVKTGRSAIVMINDRGPFVKKRIIDLSVAAARELGLTSRGTAKCKIEVLAYPLVEAMGPNGNG